MGDHVPAPYPSLEFDRLAGPDPVAESLGKVAAAREVALETDPALVEGVLARRAFDVLVHKQRDVLLKTQQTRVVPADRLLAWAAALCGELGGDPEQDAVRIEAARQIGAATPGSLLVWRDAYGFYRSDILTTPPSIVPSKTLGEVFDIQVGCQQQFLRITMAGLAVFRDGQWYPDDSHYFNIDALRDEAARGVEEALHRGSITLQTVSLVTATSQLPGGLEGLGLPDHLFEPFRLLAYDAVGDPTRYPSNRAYDWEVALYLRGRPLDSYGVLLLERELLITMAEQIYQGESSPDEALLCMKVYRILGARAGAGPTEDEIQKTTTRLLAAARARAEAFRQRDQQ